MADEIEDFPGQLTDAEYMRRKQEKERQKQDAASMAAQFVGGDPTMEQLQRPMSDPIPGGKVTVDGIDFDVGEPILTERERAEAFVSAYRDDNPFMGRGFAGNLAAAMKSKQVYEQTWDNVKRTEKALEEANLMIEAEQALPEDQRHTTEELWRASLIAQQFGISVQEAANNLYALEGSDQALKTNWMKVAKDLHGMWGGEWEAAIAAGPLRARLLETESKSISAWDALLHGKWGGKLGDIQLEDSMLEDWGQVVAEPWLDGYHFMSGTFEEYAKAKETAMPETRKIGGAEEAWMNILGTGSFVAANIATSVWGATAGGLIGGPAGAIAGGIGADIAMNVATQTGPMSYELEKMGMHEDDALALSVSAAALGGTIAHLGLSKGVSAVSKKLANKMGLRFARETFEETLTKGERLLIDPPTRFGSFVRGTAQSYALGVSTIAGMAAVNASAMMVGEYSVGREVDFEKAFGSVLASIKSAVVGLAPWALLGGYGRVHQDTMDIVSALREQGSFSNLVASLEASTLFRDNPDAGVGVFSQMAKAANRNPVAYIDAEAAKAISGTTAKELGIDSAQSDGGFIKVNAAVLAVKIARDKTLRQNLSQHIKFSENGRTLRQLTDYSQRIAEEVERQYTEPRKLKERGPDSEAVAPAIAVSQDIEAALIRGGTEPRMAKATADAFAYWFANLSAKVGKSKMYPEFWDAYSLWARNPLWMQVHGVDNILAQGGGEGASVFNPYYRTFHFAQSVGEDPAKLPAGASPLVYPARHVSPRGTDVVGNAATIKLTSGDGSGSLIPEQKAPGVRVLNAISSDIKQDGIRQTAPVLAVKTTDEGIVVANEANPRDLANTVTMSHEDLLKALEGIRTGSVTQPLYVFAANLTPDTKNWKGELEARGSWMGAEDLIKNLQYANEVANKNIDEAGEASRAGGTTTIPVPALLSDNTALMPDIAMWLGPRSSSVPVAFHEMVHYADMVLTNVVSMLGKDISPALEADVRELWSWVGRPTKDINGKALSGYEMAQANVLLETIQLLSHAGRFEDPVTGETKWAWDPDRTPEEQALREAMARVPNAPALFDITITDKTAQERMAKTARRMQTQGLIGSEKLAYAFQALVTTGAVKDAPPRVRSAMDALADVVRSYALTPGKNNLDVARYFSDSFIENVVASPKGGKAAAAKGPPPPPSWFTDWMRNGSGADNFLDPGTLDHLAKYFEDTAGLAYSGPDPFAPETMELYGSQEAIAKAVGEHFKDLWDGMAETQPLPQAPLRLLPGFALGKEGQPYARDAKGNYAKGAHPFGSDQQVVDAFLRFFAANDAAIGVGAEIRGSTLVAIRRGKVPDKMPGGVASRHGRGGMGAVDAEIAVEISGGKLYAEDPSQKQNNRDDAGEAVPQELHESIRKALIERLKETEQAIAVEGFKKPVKGRSKIRQLIERDREKVHAFWVKVIQRDPIARAMMAMQDSKLYGHLVPPEAQAQIKAVLDSGREMKVDITEVEEVYGKDIARALPRWILATGRRDERAVKAIPAADMAAMFGQDPTKFLASIGEMRSFKKLLDKKVEDTMTKMYGEMLYDPVKLVGWALEEAFNSDEAVKRLMADRRELQKAIWGDKYDPRQELADKGDLMKKARELIETDQVKDLQPDRILGAMKKAGEDAFDYAQRGLLHQAFMKKEEQLYNHVRWLAVREQRAVMDKIRSKLEKKSQTDGYRATLGKAGMMVDAQGVQHMVLQEISDGVMELLGLRDTPTGFSPSHLKLGTNWDLFSEYVRNKAANLDVSVEEMKDILQRLQERAAANPSRSGEPGRQGGNDWSSWNFTTVRDAERIDRFLTQLGKLAKEEEKIRIDGEERSLAETIKAVQEDILQRRLPERQNEHYDMGSHNRDPKMRLFRSFRHYMNAFREPEAIMGRVSEKLRKSIMDDFRAARRTRDALAEKILVWWDREWRQKGNTPEWRTFLYKDIDLVAEGLDPRGKADEITGYQRPVKTKITGAEILMIALHMGNEENKSRLLYGFDWSEAKVLDLLGKYLNKEQLEWVQATWDFFNQELWPQVRAKHERQTGLPLKETPAHPISIKLASGETVNLRGGYFPAKYDMETATRAGGAPGGRGSSDKDLGFYYKGTGSHQTPSTFKGHTKARTPGFADRLSLDPQKLSSHMVQVIHDLAFDDFVKNTGKLFSHTSFSDLVTRFDGSNSMTQLNDWLWNVANGYTNLTPDAMKGVSGFFNKMRNNSVIGILGLRFGIAAGDLTNVTAAIAAGKVRPQDVAAVTPKIVGAMAAWMNGGEDGILALYEDLKSRSSVVNHRSQHHVIELRQKMSETHADRGLIQAIPGIGKTDAAIAANEKVQSFKNYIKKHAFVMQEWIDKITTMVIWEAKYKEAAELGLAEADRVSMADRAVEGALPHLEELLKPSALRTNSLVTPLFMFMGYFNKVRNMGADLKDEALRAHYLANAGDISKGAAYAKDAEVAVRLAAMFFVVGPASEYLTGRGKEKGETLGQYVTRMMVAAPFYTDPVTSFAGEHIGRQLAAWMSGKKVKRSGQFGTGLYSARAAPGLAFLEQIAKNAGEIMNDKADGWTKAWAATEALLYLNGLPARQSRMTLQYAQRLATGDARPSNFGDVASGLVYGEKKNKQNQPDNPIKALTRAVK